MSRYRSFRIKLPSANASATSVYNYGNAVKVGLSANVATYASPTPTVAQLTTALDELLAADVPKTERSENTRNTLLQKIAAVMEMLEDLAPYVIGIAGNDRYKAGLSGFPLSKEESTVRHQGPFGIKSVKPGEADGTVDIVLSNRGGNDYFKVFRKVDDVWVLHDAFQNKSYTLTNLPSGTSIIKIVGYKSDMPGSEVETVAKAL
ncbi:MAG: hypothetical protein GC192_07970 [Bacteroidetes bacterium]|nr:hypothetical protein [Bacteroidota bacterium]